MVIRIKTGHPFHQMSPLQKLSKALKEGTLMFNIFGTKTALLLALSLVAFLFVIVSDDVLAHETGSPHIDPGWAPNPDSTQAIEIEANPTVWEAALHMIRQLFS